VTAERQRRDDASGQVEESDDDRVRPSPVVARLAGAIVDFTIVVVLVLPIQLLWTHYESFEPDATKVPTGPANWLSLAIIVGYPVISIARYGQTIGKRATSLRVVRADGRPAGWLASIVRFAVSFAPFLTGPIVRQAPAGAGRTALEVLQVLLMAAVYLPIPFDDQRRGIHDRVARTRVVTELPPLLRAPISGGRG